jgi:protease IV
VVKINNELNETKKEKTSVSKIMLFIFLGFILFIGIFFIILIFVIIAGLTGSSSTTSSGSGNVALIELSGIIMGSSSSSLFSTDISSKDVVELIERADKDRSISAIIFMINSGGGSAVATDEIASAIKRTNKTKVAVIREVGASGAYWIASSCDYIFANKMSIVGSIGVTSAGLGFEGFIERYNITYRQITTAEYKDIGSPFRKMTDEEIQLLKNEMNIIHDVFVEEVANNRNLPKSDVEKLANGLFWTGVEAKNKRLIDDFGGEKEAIKYIEEKLDIKAKTVKIQKRVTFMDAFMGVINDYFYSLGFGIGNAFLTKEQKNNNILYL